MRARAAWLCVALVVRPAGAAPPEGAPKGTIEQLAADLGASAAATLDDAAAAEGADAAWRDVAVTARAKAGASLGRVPAVVEGLVVNRIAGALRTPVRGLDALPGGDEAAARRAGYEVWIDVELAITENSGNSGNSGGSLVALARVVPVRGPFWREVMRRVPGGGVAGAATARVKVDAEIRTFVDAGEPPRPDPDPQPKPPKTRRMFFRAQKSAVDLGAPLLALAAGDVDADGKVELVALTSDEIVVLAIGKDAATVERRHALTGDAPVPRPREAMGALVVADVTGDATPEILARSSEHVDAVVLGWSGGTLAPLATALPAYPAYVTRDAKTARVATIGGAPGVAWYDPAALAVEPAGTGAGPRLPARVLSLEGAAGRTGVVLSAVDATGGLALYRAGDEAPWAQLAGAGFAHEVVDLDEDGQPEVVTSAYRPPGEGDVLVVSSVASDGTVKVLHRGSELRGGIAAIASGDLDGDGSVDVAAAARLPASSKFDLWVLN